MQPARGAACARAERRGGGRQPKGRRWGGVRVAQAHPQGRGQLQVQPAPAGGGALAGFLLMERAWAEIFAVGARGAGRRPPRWRSAAGHSCRTLVRREAEGRAHPRGSWMTVHELSTRYFCSWLCVFEALFPG